MKVIKLSFYKINNFTNSTRNFTFDKLPSTGRFGCGLEENFASEF